MKFLFSRKLTNNWIPRELNVKLAIYFWWRVCALSQCYKWTALQFGYIGCGSVGTLSSRAMKCRSFYSLSLCILLLQGLLLNYLCSLHELFELAMSSSMIKKICMYDSDSMAIQLKIDGGHILLHKIGFSLKFTELQTNLNGKDAFAVSCLVTIFGPMYRETETNTHTYTISSNQMVGSARIGSSTWTYSICPYRQLSTF